MSHAAATEETPEQTQLRRVPTPRRIVQRRTLADRGFRSAMTIAALAVASVLVLIALFLALRAMSALRVMGVMEFLTEEKWVPESGRFGIGAALPGTLLIAAVAFVVGIPVALGAALYTTEYCPHWLRRPLITIVDLMAAVPSIVYALFGALFLQSGLIGVSRWLSDHLGFIPFLAVSTPHELKSSFTASMFLAGVTVALMVIPVSCALMQQVFSQTPVAEREAALALGATRWGVARRVVLPFGRGGIVGAAMLGLGRALGETIIIAKILNVSFDRTVEILGGHGDSITATIALRFNESGDFGLSALIAAGLALFTLTLVVNALGAFVISRSRSGAVTEA